MAVRERTLQRWVNNLKAMGGEHQSIKLAELKLDTASERALQSIRIIEMGTVPHLTATSRGEHATSGAHRRKAVNARGEARWTTAETRTLRRLR